MPEDLTELLARKRILVFLGPGGVGKTTMSASLAVAGAMSGRKTAVLTVDPARRLANALGLDSLNAEQRTLPESLWQTARLSPTGTLDAMMLDTKRASDTLIETHAPTPEVRDRILSNPLYEQVSTALAGSHEYLAMEKLYELHHQQDYELMVLDTPPAAHALDFLEAPHRLLDGMDVAGFERFLTSVSSVGRGGLGMLHLALRVVVAGLSRFTGAGLLTDLADFMLSFSTMFAGFKDRARSVMALLASEETAFLVVTAPAPFAISEAQHLRRCLEERGLPFGGYVVNRFHAHHEGLPPIADWPTPDALSQQLRSEHRPLAIVEPTMLRRTLGTLFDILEEEEVRADQDARAVESLRRGPGRSDAVITVPDFAVDVHDLAGLHAIACSMGLDYGAEEAPESESALRPRARRRY